MDTKTYNRFNFHKHTFCIFTEAELSAIEGRKPDYKSKSGSSYFFTETGVYRLSNHWGRAANCKWRLESAQHSQQRIRLGFALWSAFHKDNETEKLYFIAVDLRNKTVHYEHVGASDPKNALLRTASETIKVIKQIRNLLETDSWAKYFEMDIDVLREIIIGKLVTTNQTLPQIKSELTNA